MRIIPFLLCLLLSVAAIGQKQVQYSSTKEELQVKSKALQAEIAETQRQLDDIKNNKKATMGQLRILQNKLAQRQSLIANINDELGDIDNDIRNSSKDIGALKQKLEQLKIRYAQSIRYAYETRSSYDMLAFLFSSADFNDAMRRMKYLKRFREFRKEQVEQIRTTEAQLQHKIGTLNSEKAQKDELLNSQVKQKQVLVAETTENQQAVEALKGKEKELAKKIEENRKVSARVNKAINDYINREVEAATKKAAEEAKKRAAADAKLHPGEPAKTAKTSTETIPVAGKVNPRVKPPKTAPAVELLTPTEVALANSFASNQGKLPWPVEKGYITDHFGVHTIPGTKVDVNQQGIDIQTAENAQVRAVYDGVVFKVFSVTGSNLMIVVIQHGNYFTVYNGLASTAVKAGQTVTTKSPLGIVGKNDEDLPVINFQVWKYSGKNNVTLNPEPWLVRAH